MLSDDNTSLASFSNQSKVCGAVLNSQWERFGATLANFVVMCIALVGNVLILVVIVNSKSMKNTTDIFIANMALSDLIFPLLVIPRRITEIYFGERRWLVGGNVGLGLCKTLFFLQDLSTAVSIFSLVLITIDRFYAIVLPLRRFLITRNSCIAIAMLTWVLGSCIHGVYFEAFTLMPGHQNYLYCFLRWDINILKSYYISLFIFLAFVPLILMTIVYSVIFARLKRQQGRLGISLTDPQNTQRSMRQRKVLYLSFAIVVSFTVAWAPLNAVVFLDFFIYDHAYEDSCFWNTFLYIGMFLAYASSAVNPIITFMFSSKFRIASRELIARIGRHYIQRSNQVTNITTMEMHTRTVDHTRSRSER